VTPVPGLLDKKKAEEDATLSLIKDGIFFPLFLSVTNSALFISRQKSEASVGKSLR
jgi:hypothetical protein